MRESEAVDLIRKAIDGRRGVWADLGAGDGMFTRALVELIGPGSRVYAVDRDAESIAELQRWAMNEAPEVVTVEADFTQSLDLPGLGQSKLDGIVLANALHFVPDARAVLARLAAMLRPGGRVVVVEYDRARAGPWVPHPIPASRWPALTASAGLANPVITAMRPSAFGGELYVAVADLPVAGPARPACPCR